MSRRLWRIAVLGTTCLAPLAPVSAQTSSLETVGVISEPADLVRVSGSRVYLAAGSTLAVVDIQNPAAPKRRGSLKLPDTIYGFVVASEHAYVANGLRGLSVVSVANPDAPAIVGTIKTPGEALRVAATGTKALVGNRMSGVEVFDISNPAAPKPLGSHYTDGYTRDVAAAGSLAFVVDSSRDFAVLDLMKPTPSALGVQQSALLSEIVAVPGPGSKTAYVLGGDAMQIYDVSDPAAPQRVAVATLGGRAASVAFGESAAYVAAGPAGLQILDVADPKTPKVVGLHKTTGPARDVAIAGSLILVAVGPAAAEKASVLMLRRR